MSLVTERFLEFYDLCDAGGFHDAETSCCVFWGWWPQHHIYALCTVLFTGRLLYFILVLFWFNVTDIRTSAIWKIYQNNVLCFVYKTSVGFLERWTKLGNIFLHWCYKITPHSCWSFCLDIVHHAVSISYLCGNISTVVQCAVQNFHS